MKSSKEAERGNREKFVSQSQPWGRSGARSRCQAPSSTVSCALRWRKGEVEEGSSSGQK